jgi:hypothetical protein
MCDLSNTTGSISDIETSWQDGDFAEAFIGKNHNKDIIRRANLISIIDIFKHYGLRIDENNRKHTCPFKSHKGGRETTASFQYYSDTNTFFCFGCKAGGGCSAFVAAMESINQVKAANKILSLFESDAYNDFDCDFKAQDFSEQLEIMLDFSNSIREFRENHYNDNAFVFAEKLCKIYDDFHDKYAKENDLNKVLRSLVQKLKISMNIYVDE